MLAEKPGNVLPSPSVKLKDAQISHLQQAGTPDFTVARVYTPIFIVSTRIERYFGGESIDPAKDAPIFSEILATLRNSPLKPSAYLYLALILVAKKWPALLKGASILKVIF